MKDAWGTIEKYMKDKYPDVSLSGLTFPTWVPLVLSHLIKDLGTGDEDAKAERDLLQVEKDLPWREGRRRAFESSVHGLVDCSRADCAKRHALNASVDFYGDTATTVLAYDCAGSTYMHAVFRNSIA